MTAITGQMLDSDHNSNSDFGTVTTKNDVDVDFVKKYRRPKFCGEACDEAGQWLASLGNKMGLSGIYINLPHWSVGYAIEIHREKGHSFGVLNAVRGVYNPESSLLFGTQSQQISSAIFPPPVMVRPREFMRRLKVLRSIPEWCEQRIESIELAERRIYEAQKKWAEEMNAELALEKMKEKEEVVVDVDIPF